MRPSILIMTLAAAGLVVAATALRSATPVEAASSNRPISFELPFTEDQTRTIGRVPAGHTLVLHDFYVMSGVGNFQLLVDGNPVGPNIVQLGPSSSSSSMLSFVAGISIPGGSQLSIHRLLGTSTPVVNLYIGALLQ